jgi:hypothetical protein
MLKVEGIAAHLLEGSDVGGEDKNEKRGGGIG